jgi:hypothetical protein
VLVPVLVIMTFAVVWAISHPFVALAFVVVIGVTAGYMQHLLSKRRAERDAWKEAERDSRHQYLRDALDATRRATIPPKASPDPESPASPGQERSKTSDSDPL